LPESLLSRRLKLGTFLGIGLYVHWSFSLVIAFVAISSFGSGVAGITFSIAQLFGVFFCVTLHEYGHAMAARQFGIATADITLLPIGGVARLRRMPRIPWQELVVAVAGPAVNVVIAALLILGFLLVTDGAVLWAVTHYLISVITGAAVNDVVMSTIFDVFTLPSLLGFFVVMLVVNIMLVVFNMIPAFPMDGGRVFRSLLAMIMEYRKATTIASRVGLVCAALMAMLALSADPPHPIPVLIAVFIGYAGIAEARHVEVMESVRGLKAGQVMLRSEFGLQMDMPLAEIASRWQSVSIHALPVLSSKGIVVGMLELREVADAVAADKDPATTAGQLIDHGTSTGTVRVDEELESALMRTGRHRRQIPVVDSVGRLVGILDLDTMVVRGKLLKYAGSPPSELIESSDSEHFDQTT
jgi:Zn-dependent protease